MQTKYYNDENKKNICIYALLCCSIYIFSKMVAFIIYFMLWEKSLILLSVFLFLFLSLALWRILWISFRFYFILFSLRFLHKTFLLLPKYAHMFRFLSSGITCHARLICQQKLIGKLCKQIKRGKRKSKMEFDAYAYDYDFYEGTWNFNIKKNMSKSEEISFNEIISNRNICELRRKVCFASF